MKGCIDETKIFGKKIIVMCIVAALIAGLSTILRGDGFLYISILTGVCVFGALLVFRYHWVAILNILLLSMVRFEPAPSDLIFIFLLLTGVIAGHLRFHRMSHTTPMILFPILYILIGTLQLFIAHEKMAGIRYHLITIYLIAYSYYLLLYISWDNIKDIIRAYVVSSTVSALLGLMGHIGLLPSILMYDRYRVMALFKDPNVFGPFLVPAVILLIEDVWRKKIICGPVWIHFVLTIVNLFGIILSFSRGAWLNTCVCLLVYLALNIKKICLRDSDLKKILFYGFLIMIVISTIWSTVIPYEYRQFLLSRINFQTYDRDRFETQIKGIAMAFINIFGYGPGQFEYYVLRYTGSVFSAHNLYIRLAMENGIIGFLLFLGCLTFIIYELTRHHLQERTYIVITPASLVAILIGILINSIVIDTIHWRHLWFFIGLSMASITMSQIDAPATVSDDFRSAKQVPGINPTYR